MYLNYLCFHFLFPVKLIELSRLSDDMLVGIGHCGMSEKFSETLDGHLQLLHFEAGRVCGACQDVSEALLS